MMNTKTNDTERMKEYAAQAMAFWGNTPEYKEYEERGMDRSPEEQQNRAQGLMNIFTGFRTVKEKDPGSEEAQRLVKKLQDYITENYYTCSKAVLKALGKMYGGGGEFTANINAFAGEGTAEYAAAAIEHYCA